MLWLMHPQPNSFSDLEVEGGKAPGGGVSAASFIQLLRFLFLLCFEYGKDEKFVIFFFFWFLVMIHRDITVVCVFPWRRVPPPTLGQWQMTDKGWLGSSFYICSDTHLSIHPRGSAKKNFLFALVWNRFSSCFQFQVFF